MVCKHATLSFEPSPNAASVGFQRPSVQQRAAAASTTLVANRKKSADSSNIIDGLPELTFPAPLILPDDDLSNDPGCPPQSLRSWTREKNRNKVTPDRNIIYVAYPPDVDSDVNYVRKWCDPNPKKTEKSGSCPPPMIDGVVDYLAAFYHGMKVKSLPTKLRFTTWDDEPPKSKRTTSSKSKASPKPKIPSRIGLASQTECIGIRARPSPDHVFPAQLNLDDILEVALESLPEDAYAILLLVNHDLYEDDDDEFVCGRAYGGSRVSVISTARYNPALDGIQEVEREHGWPASHCESYIKTCIDASSSSKRPKKKTKTDSTPNRSQVTTSTDEENATSPMHVALSAYINTPPLTNDSSQEIIAGTWLARVCRTSSHELGHCFGMDHCVYYACIMQGSGNVIEDVRQPPYLCPVDLAKLLNACGRTEDAQLGALLVFCERYPKVQLFMAFAAWIRARKLQGGGE